MPAIAGVQGVRDGETLTLGEVTVTARATPGSTSWTWRSCAGGLCKDVVFAASLNPISSDGYRYPAHPALSEGLSRAFDTVRAPAVRHPLFVPSERVRTGLPPRGRRPRRAAQSLYRSGSLPGLCGRAPAQVRRASGSGSGPRPSIERDSRGALTSSTRVSGGLPSLLEWSGAGGGEVRCGAGPASSLTAWHFWVLSLDHMPVRAV